MARAPGAARGYADAGYADSLSEFGAPRELPRAAAGCSSGRIAGESEHDLMGPYPIFACPNWAGLADDLDALRGRAVSVVVVADPLAPVTEPDLRQAFPDRVAPFKPHQVRDLDRPAALPSASPPSSPAGRACGRGRGLRRPDGAPGGMDASLCRAWSTRHGVTGIAAFSRAAFRRQLAAARPGGLRAVRDGETVGMALWFEDGADA